MVQRWLGPLEEVWQENGASKMIQETKDTKYLTLGLQIGCSATSHL